MLKIVRSQSPVLDSHAPVKLMSFKHRASPFISPKIKDKMKVRHILQNARRTRHNTDWTLFKRTQIKVKKMITEAEKRFVHQEIMQNKNNSSCHLKNYLALYVK